MILVAPLQFRLTLHTIGVISLMYSVGRESSPAPRGGSQGFRT